MPKEKGKSRKVTKVNEYYQIGYVIEAETGDKYPFLQDLTTNPEITRGKVDFYLEDFNSASTSATGTKKVAVDLEDDESNQ